MCGVEREDDGAGVELVCQAAEHAGEEAAGARCAVVFGEGLSLKPSGALARFEEGVIGEHEGLLQ